MIRILIADDHAIVRAGLKQFIADQPDMVVAGEAATGSEAIALVRGGEFPFEKTGSRIFFDDISRRSRDRRYNHAIGSR